MFEAYFDDAGTPRDEDVICWAGYIAQPRAWRIFDKRWEGLLSDPLEDGSKPALKKGFHLSHCAASLGEFKDYRPAERDRVRFNFRETLKPVDLENGLSVALYPIGCAVYRPDYDEIITGKLRELLGSPSAFCLRNCVQFAIHFSRDWGSESVDIYIDMGAYNDEIHSHVFEATMFDIRKLGMRRVQWHTQRVADTYGLQAADTIATEFRWGVKSLRRHREEKPTAHQASLIDNMVKTEPWGLNVLRREEIENIARQLNNIIKT